MTILNVLSETLQHRSNNISLLRNPSLHVIISFNSRFFREIIREGTNVTSRAATTSRLLPKTDVCNGVRFVIRNFRCLWPTYIHTKSNNHLRAAFAGTPTGNGVRRREGVKLLTLLHLLRRLTKRHRHRHRVHFKQDHAAYLSNALFFVKSRRGDSSPASLLTSGTISVDRRELRRSFRDRVRSSPFDHRRERENNRLDHREDMCVFTTERNSRFISSREVPESFERRAILISRKLIN